MAQAALGRLRLSQGALPDARSAFERALSFEGNYLDALEGILTVEMRTSPDAAVSRIGEHLRQDPDNAGMHYLAAGVYAAMNRSEDTEMALREVIRLDPGHTGAYRALGNLLVAQGRVEEALAQFESSVARGGAPLEATLMAATLLQSLGRTAAAGERYQAALAIDPRAALAANNLAMIRAEQGDLDEALRLAQVAKAERPNNPAYNDTLGWVYLQRRLPALAVAPLELSVAADPDNALYQFRLGLAYAGADRASDARAALARALELDSSFAGADEARDLLASLRD
jgi:tetratricopeptide (TPR) repeat protein